MSEQKPPSIPKHRPLNVAILGSTGSIGTQALDVVAKHSDKVRVVALGAHSNTNLLIKQAQAFGVSVVAVGDEQRAQSLQGDGAPTGADGTAIEVVAGQRGLAHLATLDGVDLVLNAVSGFAGLVVTVETLKAGKRLGLANKESLVAGGELVTALVSYKDQIIPVDSEHSAIFQCLLGEEPEAFSKIWLTASGGPFRHKSAAELRGVTVGDALAHPTWNMGAKITIDSATLMNKGLEVIEAKHLFNVSYDDIVVVVHPQSCVHSMVEFADSSVKAHLGVTDMRIPIQLAFSYPHRWAAPVPPVDFRVLGSLTFEPPASDEFPCLPLAIEAGKTGGTMPAVLNAANEVAVDAFLHEQCGFLDIPRIVEAAMSGHKAAPLSSLEQVYQADAEARQLAHNFAKSLG